MKVNNFETYNFYYDPEGDFLEVIFGESPEQGYSEEIEPDVFIHRVEDTGEIYGIGILGFKKRVKVLGKILEQFNIESPLEIGITNSHKLS